MPYYTNSPTLARFNAGRTFDVEDDVEFCPVLTEDDIQLLRYRRQPGYSSPSPVPVAAQTTPPPHSSSPSYYSGSPVGRHTAVAGYYVPGTTPRPRRDRALDIIDPNTGGSVSPQVVGYGSQGGYGAGSPMRGYYNNNNNVYPGQMRTREW
jgi:hypothetical protein